LREPYLGILHKMPGGLTLRSQAEILGGGGGLSAKLQRERIAARDAEQARE